MASVDADPYARPTDPAKRKSAALTDGVDRAAARAMLKGIGLDDEAGRPRFAELREQGKRRAEDIERVGAELRALAGTVGLHGTSPADVGAHGVH